MNHNHAAYYKGAKIFSAYPTATANLVQTLLRSKPRKIFNQSRETTPIVDKRHLQ